ncbi:hypothetical protein [Candidatus Sneabacter namystus]|uniref:DUF2335 domain-containing protein n=1 Tax=Candidatus Sneabacter namystus TaxID=2601646 RepID=A0A5C0UJZ6_9RICK|nr:hypothetical protein [Candidatus Sneabacter namystus]QEK39752.1 hypothetical protein FZC37_02325 [Candidatus Sneabacter namystus]
MARKDSKNFFYKKNNSLNKGFTKTKQDKRRGYNTNIGKILPPVEVVAAYEEMSPGSFAKILEMTYLEQQVKNSLSKQTAKNTYKARISGQICGCISCIAACFTTVKLAKMGAIIYSVCFFSACITTVLIVSIVSIYLKKSSQRQFTQTF